MKTFLKHALRTALLAGCLGGCSPSDGLEGLPLPGQPAEMQLRITTREAGDLNTRAPGDDPDPVGEEPGTTHEFMHSLCVFIVDDAGTVVEKIAPDLSTNAAAQEGNLRTYSQLLTLVPGTYTFYAFANIDATYSTELYNIIGIKEGAPLQRETLEGIVLDDPAAKIDFNDADGNGSRHFIPMSAVPLTVTVTPATTGISIGLDRLVSKVHISLQGASAPSATGLTFSGWADCVALLSANAAPADVTCDGERTFSQAEVAATGGLEFYVNETVAHAAPFAVSVTTSNRGGTTYTATTARYDLPRNSIYPLVLTLDDYGLDIRVQCWVSPIGSYPVPVVATLDPNTYEVKLPEGAQFQFDINGVYIDENTSQRPADIACTWSFDASAVSGLDFDGYTTGNTTVAGHVTASAGQEIPLTAQATWTDDGQSYNRTYTLRVVTTDITDVEFQAPGTTRAASSRWLDVEVLNMYSYK